ncbi:MAG: hypothetical protein ACQET7_06295 [Thermodesulfobacteriota bacterium]
MAFFYAGYSISASFHPEMVFFANLGVNLRGCLCGVLQYASAQPLDFLDLDKKILISELETC